MGKGEGGGGGGEWEEKEEKREGWEENVQDIALGRSVTQSPAV